LFIVEVGCVFVGASAVSELIIKIIILTYAKANEDSDGENTPNK